MAEPTFAGCLIQARPIGLLDLNDHGAYDGKILCVPAADPRQSKIHSIRQIASSQLEEVAERERGVVFALWGNAAKRKV